MDTRRKPPTHHPAPDPDAPDTCVSCHLPLDKPNRRHGLAYRIRRLNEERDREHRPRMPQATLF